MPRVPSDQDTRSLILQVAETQFGAKGYSGTHLQSIAAEVGVQKTALYYYFPSKSALYTAVIQSMLEAFESARGEIAAWLLIVFGLVYFIWGVRRAVLNRPHRHEHKHLGDVVHEHSHDHHDEHAHPHLEKGRPNYTPWVLFVIFVLGPCEPLIPILLYPAARHDMGSVILVGSIFSVVTVGTMLAAVMLSLAGVKMVRLDRLERYSHALAGAIVMFSGLGIRFLGL